MTLWLKVKFYRFAEWAHNHVCSCSWYADKKWYTDILNPTGATCPCSMSSAVWCSECQGNQR